MRLMAAPHVYGFFPGICHCATRHSRIAHVLSQHCSQWNILQLSALHRSLWLHGMSVATLLWELLTLQFAV